MTTTIEHSRRHGPHDPRWQTLRSLKETGQLEEARPGAIAPAAVQAWEGDALALPGPVSAAT